MIAAPLAHAQDAALRLTGDLPLSRLVDMCAERLGVVLEYQLKALTETVTLRGPVSDGELWDLTNRLLAARGFTTIRVGDSPALSVVRLQDAMGTARIESSPDAADPVPAGYVRVLAPIVNRDVASVLEAIRPLLSKPAGGLGHAHRAGPSEWPADGHAGGRSYHSPSLLNDQSSQIPKIIQKRRPIPLQSA